MKTLRVLSLSVLLLTKTAMAADAPFQNGRWIDLSHDFSTNTLYWPTASGFVLETEFRGKTPKGYFYEANKYSASEHGGTHLDAPVHFAEGHKAVDQLALEQLTGAAVVLDVSGAAAKNSDHQVTEAEITAWEKSHGQIPAQSIVLFHTGYGKKWPNAEKYLGTAGKGLEAVEKLHFPGLHPDAARWLVKERKVKAVGLDTASIDYGQSKLFETHRILFENDVPAFENVADLHLLPAKGAYIVALPMKIKEGSGAPLRIVAWVARARR